MDNDAMGGPVVRPRHLRLGAEALHFDAFRELLDRNPELMHVELAGGGELFLNPELPLIMQYAFDCGVRLTSGDAVYFDAVGGQTLEALVRFRFRHIPCAIDGTSDETYSGNREGADYGALLANIRLLDELKERHRSPYPRLVWQFTASSKNRHEIAEARLLARDLGMRFLLQPSLPEARLILTEEDAVCGQLWRMPRAACDGRVFGCTRNTWAEFGGNVFEDGVRSIANTEPMGYARGMLLGYLPARDDIPCTICEVYLEREAAGWWITGIEAQLPRQELDRLRLFGLGHSLGASVAVALWRTWEMAVFYLERWRRKAALRLR